MLCVNGNDSTGSWTLDSICSLLPQHRRAIVTAKVLFSASISQVSIILPQYPICALIGFVFTYHRCVYSSIFPLFKINNQNDKKCLETAWATAIGLALLETEFASLQDEWQLLANKAKVFCKKTFSDLSLCTGLISDGASSSSSSSSSSRTQPSTGKQKEKDVDVTADEALLDQWLDEAKSTLKAAIVCICPPAFASPPIHFYFNSITMFIHTHIPQTGFQGKETSAACSLRSTEAVGMQKDPDRTRKQSRVQRSQQADVPAAPACICSTIDNE